jgi:predicted DNA-binding protein
MPKAKRDPQFSVSMPDPMFRRVTELAREDGRSRSGYVARIVAQHLNDLEAEPTGRRKAIAA